MPRIVWAAVCLLALTSLDASAQNRKRVPRFEDYPVKQIHEAKTAQLVLDTEDLRNSSTYYQAVADGGTNFAGRYAVAPLTCGENCVSADFIDTTSGRVIPGTFTNSGWSEHHDAFREIEFRRASRLIVFAGQIDREGPLGWHFYVLDSGSLKRIHTLRTKDFRKPLAEWMK